MDRRKRTQIVDYATRLKQHWTYGIDCSCGRDILSHGTETVMTDVPMPRDSEKFSSSAARSSVAAGAFL